jgi:hypothetical protein
MILLKIYLLFVAICGTGVGYLIVKVDSTNFELHNRTFLLNRGVASEIIDNDTIKFLGFDSENLQRIPYTILNMFHRIPDFTVPVMKMSYVCPDEAIRVEMLKINTLQVPLIYGLLKLGEYINPAVIKWRNRLFLGCGLAWGFIAGKAANEHLEFQWINSSYYPFHSTESSYLGINTTIHELDRPIVGQDPRFVLISPTKLFVVFTNRFGRQERMGMTELDLAPPLLTATVRFVFNTIVPPGEHNRHSQKNWSPFLFNRSVVLFIQRINPLHVLGTEDYYDPALQQTGEIRSHTVSLAPTLTLSWQHGEIRGGTNAIFLEDRGFYLSLFHSNSHVNGNWLKTYWMGAYTFSGATLSLPLIFLSICLCFVI